MRELRFERDFRRWAEGAGYGWEVIRYPRAAALGETTAVRITPGVAPRGVVLVAHGAGNDALFALVGLFKSLLSDGYEVFTWDLDGHGRRATTRLTPAVTGAVADAALRSGAAARGLPLHCVGVSLGGSVLLAALPTLSPAPRSAALLTAPLRVQLGWPAIRRELGTPLARVLWRERSHYGLTGLIPSFGPFKRGSYPLRLGVPAGPGMFGYVEALNRLLEGMGLEEAARSAPVPTLLVYGGRDLLVPLEQGRRLAELLPDAELLVLPRETHLSAPLAPESAAAVRQWIAR